jgi:glycosyltransferase involved in cell wall biosynthesis
MTARGISFNGKFLSASPTGVHRVAHELITHADALLASRPEQARERPWSVLKPRDADRSLPLKVMRERTVGALTWQPWEQFELPWYARGSTLVSLCNLAPLLTGGVAMIHDAQVFISPQSYGRAFLAWYRFALPAIGRDSKLILTVSDYSRRQLADYGVAPLSKIAVVHNGVDHLTTIAPDERIIATLGLAPGRYVTALANTQKHKNIRILLEAFARPALRDISLVLIGKSGAADFEAAGAPPPPNAIFAGAVSDAEMRALFARAGCLAFPSTTEGFGLPPLEAMSLGCPVVAAPLGALPEVCGDAALYADADDAEAWETAILQILESAAVRAECESLGLAQAARFSWDASAARLLDLVRAVADG